MEENQAPLSDQTSAPPRRARFNVLSAALVIAGVALLLVAVVVMAVNDTQRSKVVPPSIGRPMSNLPLTTLDGKPAHLSDYAGRPVLINAWASWCPPCKQEMPDLESYYMAHKAGGFTILAINAGEDPATAASFARQMGITFPVFLDQDESLMTALGISDYPTSILVGRDGRVKAIHVGLLTPQTINAEFTPYLGQ